MKDFQKNSEVALNFQNVWSKLTAAKSNFLVLSFCPLWSESSPSLSVVSHLRPLFTEFYCQGVTKATTAFASQKLKKKSKQPFRVLCNNETLHSQHETGEKKFIFFLCQSSVRSFFCKSSVPSFIWVTLYTTKNRNESLTNEASSYSWNGVRLKFRKIRKFRNS